MKSKLIIFLSVLVSRLSFPKFVHAQVEWNGRCIADTDVATIQGLECLFFNILQVVVWLAGIAFFVMFINGGFQYLFSNNDPKRVAVASSTLTMAVIGLIGIIASFFILRLITNFTGVNVVNFLIPSH